MNLDTFYEPDKWYWITYNPEDKCQYLGKVDRLERFRQHIADKLKIINIIYYVVIEFSEPRGERPRAYSGPRLHIHGLIKFKDTKTVLQWLNYGMYYWCKQGRLDIDTPQKLEDCFKYMRKQRILKIQYSNIYNMTPTEILGKDKGPSEERSPATESGRGAPTLTEPTDQTT